MTIEYNKIVRDKIPTIIEASGKKCNYVLPEDTDIPYEAPALRRKLDEEIAEYKAATYVNEEVEELGDIIDICYALAEQVGWTEKAIDELRQQKIDEKGGFKKKILLRSVEE